MIVKAQRIGEVPGLGDIYEVAAPWDKQIEAFGRVGAQMVDTQEVVTIRLDGIFNDGVLVEGVSDNFTRTSVMPAAVKDKPNILVRPSELMSPYAAVEAVMANANERYARRSREFYDVLEDIARTQEGIEPEDRTVLVVSRKGDFDLTPEMDETKFLLGRKAREYCEKKRHSTIPFFSLQGTSSEQTDVGYAWLKSPQGGSIIYCKDRDLNDYDAAFGVSRKTRQ